MSIDKIRNIGLDKLVTQVYDFDSLTTDELMCKFAQKINIIIEHFKYLDDRCYNSDKAMELKLQYLLGEGLEEQVAKELLKEINDGTIGKLINGILLKDINDKVDNFKVEVNEQLDNKANKNEVFTMANMGQDIKEAMTGGSVAVVDINSITDSNVIEGSVGVECLKGNYTEKSYNEIKIKGIKYSGNDLTVSSKDDYIKINGTTTTGGNIKIYFDNPSVKSGNYYIKLDDILCADTLAYKVAYADGSFTSEAYITNSNVIGLTLEEKTILYLDIYVSAGKTINYNGHIFMVSYDNASKPYIEKYTSKLITTDNIKELMTINPFKGKKWASIGDSTVYGYYEVSSGVGGRYQWQERVANYFEMEFVNLGISGSTTAGFMRDEVINNIPNDVDIITVMGGLNDQAQNVNINDVDGYEFDGGTYPGAIRNLIRYLTTNFPNAKILFCNCVGGGASQDGITLYEKNEQGKTYYDYAKKCVETTNEMNIPCIDLFSECGINLFNRSKFISDTVHPTIPGYDRIGDVHIDNFIKHKNYLCN